MQKLNDYLESCPGLCGRLARGLDSLLEFSQPAISLPAALAFMASIKSGKITTVQGFEPNLFCMSVAAPGTGKTQTIKALTKLAGDCGILSKLQSEPVSAEAIINSLEREDSPRVLYCLDEFGLLLGELVQARNGPRAAILRTLMKLYSASGGIYLASHAKTQKHENINSPYINIFGVTVENRLRDALSDDFIKDGFLSRWLIFMPDALECNRNGTPRSPALPSDIAEEIKDVESNQEKTTGNLGINIKKRVLQSNSTSTLLIQSEFVGHRRDATNILEQDFWARSFELYNKVSMCVSDNATMETDWSRELVNYLIRSQIVYAQGGLGNSKKTQAREKYRLAIPIKKWISLSSLNQSTKGVDLTLRERRELIEMWLESEDIIQQSQTDNNSRKKSTYYARTG